MEAASAIDPSVLNAMTASGYPHYSLLVILLEIVFIPFFIWIAKHYTAKNKQIIDLERTITKQERDKSHDALVADINEFKRETDTRLASLEKETNYKIDDLAKTVSSLNKTLERLFTRLDKLMEKVEDISTEVHSCRILDKMGGK